MPLRRGDIVGHDSERLSFRFTMLDRADDIVHCQISDAALDALAGMRGTEGSVRSAQFLTLRDTIEALANAVYIRSPAVKGRPVRIFLKDVGDDLIG
ncbi:DUF1488 family protein [Rhodopseudomonas palustris]|jgi:Protein of unknown function (DUF1488)|uniref:DUF1488 family protein n=1 Tax=Rhodopseudomonas TaxID=1073 RepID=UPI0006B8C41D|nr:MULTISPECIES: DUF1488 family protein [Rhodopseudomonas]KPF97224.1 hypothetical protein IP86_14365 [Rhodopseudomonas sp. AAP120]MCP9628993.1 DUF1488 family protein [Rhodopseudomonas palustris]